MDDLDLLQQEIEKRKAAVTTAVATVEQSAVPAISDESQKPTAVDPLNVGVGSAIIDTKQKIVKRAIEKINDEKIIKKHSDNIAKISDQALKVEAEKQRLKVEQVNADNKVEAQEIKNRLIVLKTEAKRLKAEQKQVLAEQRAEHKARNKAAKWEIYKDKLTKMNYSYVPNAFVLTLLLFFDGVTSFFDGVGKVSTSIVKALKWIIILSAIIIILLIIPVTRDWLLSVLQFI
jgi:hypothetical protein